MNEALKQAFEAKQLGEVPVGCVIVKNNEIIARSRNYTEEQKCATKHAEIVAIEAASEALSSSNLSGCDLYVTLEPCPMCAGAIINSKIKKVVFGAFDKEAGFVDSVTNVFSLVKGNKTKIFCGICEEDVYGVHKSAPPSVLFPVYRTQRRSRP